MTASRYVALCLALWLALCGIAGAQDDELAARSRTAREALVAGRYQEAIRLYRELVKALPDNPGLRFNLGLALAQAGQPAAAIPELERAVRGQPSMAPAWFLLGLAYQQTGQPAKAIEPLRKAVEIEGGDMRARLELADAELAAGEPQSAAEDFAELTRRDPKLAKGWQGLGLAYVAQGERAFARLAEQAPASGYWYALQARARHAAGRLAEALSLYQEAIRQASSLPGLHAARAAVYREAGHADWAAVEEERESRVPRPDCAAHPAACAALAGDWARAAAEARKSATPENLYWESVACGRLAEESFAHLAALPPSAEIHELQAESFQRTGRRLEAVAEWRKALAMKPGDRRIQGRLAESLVLNRAYEEATRLLEPLVAAAPENGEWRYLLGEALFEQRDAEGALPHLLEAARRLPNHLPTQEALGRTYLALGQPDKAVACLERARVLDDGAISFALSTAYRRLGRDREADAALARYREFTRNGAAPASGAAAVIPPP